MGLAFFVEYFDNTVKDVEGVEQAVGLPVLGVVPYLQEPGDGSGAGAEAFSSVATLVQFSSASRPPQVVLVSSPSEQEGKTTVCTYTAKALAGTLGAGVVVDADLRRPMLQKLFALEGSLGLSTYLSGNAELSELLRMLPREGLGVIPAGPIPPNPSELLGSERMKALLQALRERYEFIFIDSAPLLGLSDSVKLSSFADGVVLVARAGQTPRGALWRCRKLLEYVNAKPLGVVLNGFRHGQHRYGYYYASYRSYHYGDKG
jgi:capsular exopolysaccharide synthesis family protein